MNGSRSRLAEHGPMVVASLLLALGGCGADPDLFEGSRDEPVRLASSCGDLPDDPITVEGLACEDALLRVTVRHSGGCQDHGYAVCWEDGVIVPGDPVQVSLDLHHDDNGDACDALITRDVFVDIEDIRAAARRLDALGDDTLRILVDEQPALCDL